MTTATLDPQPAAPAAEKPKRLRRLRQVLDRVPGSETTWYELVNAGKAPTPGNIGRAPVWREDEIDAFVEARGVWPVGQNAEVRRAQRPE